MEKPMRKLPVLVIGRTSNHACEMITKLFKDAVQKTARTFETNNYNIKGFGDNAITLGHIKGYKPYYILVDDSYPISNLINDFLPLVEGDMTKIKFFSSKGDE